jgi:hypothetical protein
VPCAVGHQLARACEPREVTDLGHHGHRHDQRDPARDLAGILRAALHLASNMGTDRLLVSDPVGPVGPRAGARDRIQGIASPIVSPIVSP